MRFDGLGILVGADFVMKNVIIAFVDALSALISSPLETTFDFLEYRLALAEKKRQFRTESNRLPAFSSATRYSRTEEIHVTGMAG
jgi:hypothetical protein